MRQWADSSTIKVDHMCWPSLFITSCRLRKAFLLHSDCSTAAQRSPSREDWDPIGPAQPPKWSKMQEEEKKSWINEMGLICNRQRHCWELVCARHSRGCIHILYKCVVYSWCGLVIHLTMLPSGLCHSNGVRKKKKQADGCQMYTYVLRTTT